MSLGRNALDSSKKQRDTHFRLSIKRLLNTIVTMIKAAAVVRRVYVRQRPTCRHNVLIATSQSLLHGEHHSWSVAAAASVQQHPQICSLRLSSSIATNTTDRHLVPPSDSSNNLPQNISNDENSSNLPTKYIDFTAASKIEGEESHIATITLHPGEILRAESGSMIFMTEGVVCKLFRPFFDTLFVLAASNEIPISSHSPFIVRYAKYI